jgi:hypothetical protein
MSDIPWMYATFGTCQWLVWCMCSHKSHLSRLFLLLLRMSSRSGMNSRGRKIGRRLFLINLRSGMVLVQPRSLRWTFCHFDCAHANAAPCLCVIKLQAGILYDTHHEMSLLFSKVNSHMWVLKSNNLIYLFSKRNKHNSSNSWTHLMFHISMFAFVRYVKMMWSHLQIKSCLDANFNAGWT